MKYASINAEAIKSRPQNVHFGRGQITKAVTVADVTSSLNSTYFEMELASPTEADKDAVKQVYVWFNVGSAGVDPAISGKTGVEVAIAADATAAEVATAIKTALDGASLAELRECWIKNSNEVYIWAKFFGATTDSADGASATGFTITTDQAGRGGFMGSTQDGVELSLEPEVEDIAVDQGGTAPVASLMRGMALSATTSIMELTQERMAQIYGTTVGESFEPETGKSIVGFGTSKIGQNVAKHADELVLHPVSKDWDDYSENFHFWKAAILPGGLNLGSEVAKAQVTFTAYIDSSKDKRANIGCYGDGFSKGIRA